MAANTGAAREAKLTELSEREEQLARLIEEKQRRLLALSEESDAIRRETASKFRAKFAERYKDLDIVQALSGYPAAHVVRVFDGAYHLQPPSQGDTAELSKTLSSERLTGEESILVLWLVAVGGGGEVRKLAGMPAADRLKLIRKLPETLVLKLAEECANLQAYLNVCLEQELGNF